MACLKQDQKLKHLTEDRGKMESEKKLMEKRYEQQKRLRLEASEKAQAAEAELRIMKERFEEYGTERDKQLEQQITEYEEQVKTQLEETARFRRDLEYDKAKSKEEKEVLQHKIKECEDKIQQLTVNAKKSNEDAIKSKREPQRAGYTPTRTRPVYNQGRGRTQTGQAGKAKPQSQPVQNPFRRRFQNIKWTREEEVRLREHCSLVSKDKDVKTFILIMGPTGHGKSTLFNGFYSALKDKRHVSQYSAVGSSPGTFTRNFRPVKWEDTWIIDMAGLFESKFITDENLREFLCGDVPFKAKLSKYLEIQNKEELLQAKGDKQDIACVVLVLRSQAELAPELKRQIHVIHSLAGEGVLSCQLVITHLDKCDSQFDDPKNLPNVYASQKVVEAIQRLHRDTNISLSSIHAVRNYVEDTETDLHSKIVHLDVLDKIMSSAMDQMEMKRLQGELGTL